MGEQTKPELKLDGGPQESDEADDVVFSPSAASRRLSPAQLEQLRAVGRRWDGVCAKREAWWGALPVDPRLGARPVAGSRASRFTGVAFAAGDGGDEVVATERALRSRSATGDAAGRTRRALLGPPLHSSAVLQERMRKLVALAVLSSDALSSVAYGPEALMVVLLAAGTGALSASLPIAAAIVVLMVAVGLSYRQTIRAYPRGGGSYIVASDNLGRFPGLAAAAGLMLDYVLTVAVSVAAGVAAVSSALPAARGHAVMLGLVAIWVLALGNLRGVRQAGALFAAPTYLFIAAILLLDLVGLVQAAQRGFTSLPLHHTVAPLEGLGLLVVLRAFSSGATAMTGIEAISDGIPAFRPVQWRNARTTLTWMMSLLVVTFAATIVLSRLDGAVPSGGETLLSELGDSVFGHGTALYLLVQVATALILLLAANTAFSDFPRLLFFLARDDHAPRQFLRLGDRLAFSNGVLLLAGAASLIYLAFAGRTERLIPLFAVGVFLAFTLSQSGMVRHWLRGRGPGWRPSIAFNGLGAGLSAVVLVVTASTKFTEGAWIIVVLVPLLIGLFARIAGHYRAAERELALDPSAVQPPAPGAHPRPPARAAPTAPDGDPERQEAPDELGHLLVVPILALDLAAMRTLAYAASLGQPVLAIHLSPDEQDAQRFERYWQAWGDHLPLQIVQSPYRALVAPITRYVQALHAQRSALTITVLLPEVIVPHAWQRVLHNQVPTRLRRALRHQHGTVVTTVPFHLATRRDQSSGHAR